MSGSHDEKKKGPTTRSLALVLLAWVFISGQALLAAGSVYNYSTSDKTGDKKSDQKADTGRMPWELAGQGAQKVRLMAIQAQPDVIGAAAIFLGIANALGLVALACGLLSWSRSKHRSGKLTIAVAAAVILVNSLLNLPYV